MSGQPYPPMQPPVPPDVSSTKLLAGILGILFGGLGIHRFILGDVSGGIIRIVITVLTCGLGSIIGLIEGIIYLTKSDQDFYQTYMLDRRAWF
ncbi:MAG TPA: TM2 domain-containing protein [Candidatus Nanopelagicales bacterium]